MKKPIGIIAADTPASSRYAEEILSHAGLFPQLLPKSSLSEAVDQYRLLVLSGNLKLDEAERESLTRFVDQGGGLVAAGSTAGLDTLFGVALDDSRKVVGSHYGPPSQLGEGYIEVRSANHPITSGLASSLHTFGGVAARAQAGRSLARMRDQVNRPTDLDAVVLNRSGKGSTVLIAPDVVSSVVRIQQGTFIDQDGVPSLDGTAPLNDGILKCEDGMVLSYEHDRTAVDGDHPVFYYPIADELRELLLKSILFLAHRHRVPLPMLWYYPNDLPALGHISHDTDGNDPELGWAMLEATREAGIPTTWCTIEPGYDVEFYKAVLDYGSEIALHYDALDGRTRTSWGREQFLGQYDWLVRASGVRPVSNKNHYTRWEGRLEFFHWCVEAGIQCEQSKGNSKQGTLGFPFGGSHPWFPIDDDGSRIDCLELNMQTQDLVVTSPDYFGRYWVDQALSRHGIAHLLFHPAHIKKPGVAEALKATVDYGRGKGMAWWTCQQVNDWERARRAVRVQDIRRRRNGLSLDLAADRPLKGATLLLLDARSSETVERYGFRFGKTVCDLDGEAEVTLATR